ncbi:MAG: hypothetical protein WDM79_02790 [Terricaulis sp.]
MSPKEIIESYVDDVVLLLPARQRKDVGIELRELLFEELGNRAGENPVDEATVRALLKDFGAPGDVASRYRPAGITAIPAREGRVFAWLSIGGVLAQWALSLPIEVILPTHDDLATRLGVWAAGSGLHAFALPGALAFSAMVWAWWKHRSTGDDTVTLAFPGELPALRPIESSEVNRLAWFTALVTFAVSIPFYASIPYYIARLDEPARSTLTLDPDFVANRAPWLLVVWVAQLVLFIFVLFKGRWVAATRKIEMALNVAGAAMLAWFVLGGPMLVNPEIDGYAKLIASGITAMILAVTAIKFWREQARVGKAKPQIS